MEKLKNYGFAHLWRFARHDRLSRRRDKLPIAHIKFFVHTDS